MQDSKDDRSTCPPNVLLDEARHNIRKAIELYLEPAEEPSVHLGGLVEEIAI